MKKPIIVNFKKVGKFDKICKYCHQIIKGALRETSEKGDYEGTICSDNENYWHFKCEK
jgi:hypothetical protein